jgi:hypothetical protein
VQAALLSLPGIFGTTVTTIPADVPYLHADARLVQRWRERLAGSGQMRIGIAWQGNRAHSADRDRSIPLQHFQVLAQIPGVQLISLQKGPGIEQLQSTRGRFEVLDLSQQLDQESGPFMDTAAILVDLDLAIVSDSAVAHLAGALGVRVWVGLSAGADWRWLLGRDDSPWYPSMRLFRQKQCQQWAEVFERMADQLRARNW